MANSEAGTNSDVERAIGDEYLVFLSFRGPDTHYAFTDHLYHGLKDVGVRVFRDDKELPEGEKFGGNLLSAIDNSMIYIPIFSQTYASSIWCLRELAHIVENVSRSNGRKSILPIFFNVEPEDVKLRTSLYKDALLERENKFSGEVEKWREALAEVGKILGWNVKRDQSEAEIIKSVVDTVSKKLELRKKSVAEHLVGLDDRVKHLTELLLNVNHSDVLLVGIYGMGGIGKTTIAKVVFNELSSHFGKCCGFLENVRESMSTKEGTVQLQKKLLSDIVGFAHAERVKDSEEGMRKIEATLPERKVLVVLDDVDNKDHIKKLIGNESLNSASRIIITTRDTAVLQVRGFEGKIILYEMLEMDDAPAFQLFCRHAFGGDSPSDDYRELSREIVSSTGRLPLAIEVIGSLLYDYQNNKAVWEETSVKLRNIPEKDIVKKLRISYDDLDENQQEIFLDIACFFCNKSKNDATYMWTDCKFYPESGIQVLTSKCLIKILDNDKLWMHDQLIDMGREIVRLEGPNDLGKRSRLWKANEAIEMIRTEERKGEVQALEISGSVGSIEITNGEFERLPNLRFLKLCSGDFVGDFAKCRSKLRWISWRPALQDFRAVNFYLTHLVVFKLDRNHFTDDSKAWDLIKARNLKVLSLERCDGITTIPNFSKCLGLERLTLVCCSRLERIDRFIGHLQSLIKLEIKGCTRLIDLPEKMGALVKLQLLSLSRCSSLRGLPGSLGNLTSLIELDLTYTRIRELPSSIGKLISLRILRVSTWLDYGETDDFRFPYGETDDFRFPSGISTLVNLEVLDFSGHQELRGEIPVGIGELSSLKILNLDSTGICRIPRTINRLHHLQTLNLRGCHSIQVLPDLPTSLTRLILQSRSLLSVPNLSNLTNLVELQLHGGPWITKKSNLLAECNLSWIGSLSRLKKLILNLQNVPAPLELASLPCLEDLDLSLLDPKPLMQLPSSNWSWRNLSTLGIGWCEVEDIPLERFTRLEKLTVNHCQQLQRLSIPWELRKLREVCVYGCPELVEIQIVGLSKLLECLSVQKCESLTRICGLPCLKNLEKLRIHGCGELTWLIDASCTNIPDDCVVRICKCGDSIKDSESPYDVGMSLKRYREEILSNISNKTGLSFAIRFHLGVKRSSDGFEFVGGIKRENEDVAPDSVTYKGLIADVKCFGFSLKRMWYTAPGTYHKLLIEVKSDEQVKGMVLLASKRGSIHLYVEGGVDSEWEGEYDDEMMEMLREEWAMRTDVHSDEDGPEWDVPNPDEDADSASVGESEADGTSSIDDFRSEPDNAECVKATGNRRQSRGGRIGYPGCVDGGKAVSMENRKEEKDDSGEPADQNDFVRSSCQRCEGVEHQDSSCKATTEFEDEGALSSVKRDRTVETDRIPTNKGRGSRTGRSSNPGRKGQSVKITRPLDFEDRKGQSVKITRPLDFEDEKGQSVKITRPLDFEDRKGQSVKITRPLDFEDGKGHSVKITREGQEGA
ncbi:disease resistance protein L6-like [Rhodamnia argentea]|uniref:Disease resistance protein L6-like n=1 Tax=Rhodamnia argentea TaxID=178133 RepID=A0ABM3HBJ7_9MYRT|nr:disease resistance protein L6-like [Rhodamnia argentea]